MKSKLLISFLASLAVLLSGGAAQAFMIAGWDFSQYVGPEALSTDGVTGTNVLASNYSDSVPQNPGAAASGFGTMYLDGQFGSTNTPLDITNDPFVPSSSASASGNLDSNVDAPAGVPFSSLVLAGQSVVNPLAMTARAPAIVVFGADLAPGELGAVWSITFGGKTNTGTQGVAIEFSLTGLQGSFASAGSVNLTAVDTPFSVALGGGQSNQAWVRLTFDPAEGTQAFIDNFAFSAAEIVPEPATAAMLLVGLVGLARAGRRR